VEADGGVPAACQRRRLDGTLPPHGARRAPGGGLRRAGGAPAPLPRFVRRVGRGAVFRPKEPPICARPSHCQKPLLPELTNQGRIREFLPRWARGVTPSAGQAPAVALSLQHVTIRRPRARRAAAPRLPSNGLAKARGSSPSTGRLLHFTSPSADVRHVTIRRPRARCAAAPRPPSNGRAKARGASPSTGRLHFARTDFRCPRIGCFALIRFRMRFGSNFRTVEFSDSSSENNNSTN
jgi:hypothetical protein